MWLQTSQEMENLQSDERSHEAIAGSSTAEDEQKKITDPKLYKTSLCQFYLKGPCKNAENCQYAHGTSELRSISGGSIAEIESATGSKKSLFKTTLCAKFVTFGECPFGLQCNFAHGVKELQQALDASTAMQKDEEDKVKSNPSYKTTLCKNYMSGHYCQFAERCQYAHGKHFKIDIPINFLKSIDNFRNFIRSARIKRKTQAATSLSIAGRGEKEIDRESQIFARLQDQIMHQLRK